MNDDELRRRTQIAEQMWILAVGIYITVTVAVLSYVFFTRIAPGVATYAGENPLHVVLALAGFVVSYGVGWMAVNRYGVGS